MGLFSLLFITFTVGGIVAFAKTKQGSLGKKLSAIFLVFFVLALAFSFFLVASLGGFPMYNGPLGIVVFGVVLWAIERQVRDVSVAKKVAVTLVIFAVIVASYYMLDFLT